ncbi:hypothetical protein Pan241w_08410 [Gimesia alba]|uniref:DUF1559 domain-containing protein n=1 Tax=Gimesia alba TaxID=2527973 RepID=A0A517RA61_9PLAN|nr:DUF1559 domain-containing protein [Gimesia alba]QDT40782.1 hypothetical protein Pan241w_08410 [Gimesia alba]
MNGQRWITISVILLVILLLIALVLPAIQQAREAARRSTSKNNLKQIGLALSNYHETHGSLPPGGIIREDGTAMQGWLTMLLPYMDNSPDYYMLDFNQPWEGPDNLYVMQSVRPTYLIPGVKAHYTNFGYGLTHYLGNPHLLYRNSSVKFKQMTNGTAHTWMVGEVAGNYQPWGYPFNWRPLGTKMCNGPNSYGHSPWQGGHLLFADGSVSFFSDGTSPEILKGLGDAPPVSNQEQAAFPKKRFETGNFHWDYISLQSQPDDENVYYAKTLQTDSNSLMLINLFSSENLTESEKEELIEHQRAFPTPHFFLRIDSATDIAQALEVSSLSQAATPEQFQANVKLLESLQRQLK